MYLFYLLLLLIPMLALKQKTEGDAAILDSKSTTCIKGVLCIYVMFHNLGLDLDNSWFKELVCEHTGGIGVGLFFFLSAFGIIRSYQREGNRYLPKLLFVHIPKIYLLSVFINLLTYFSFMRGGFEPYDLFLRIFNFDIFNGFNRINRHGWYIATIILLYLIFALVYFACSKLKTEKKFIIAGIIMSAVAIGARIVALIADNGGMYTREITAFATGCVYATFYDQINALANKYFKPGLIISSIAFAIGFVVAEPLATHMAALIIIFVSQRFTYYSKITHFFGKICLGVYLFLHYSSIILQQFLDREYLWVLTNAGFIIELAVIAYAVEWGISYVIKWVAEKCKNRNNTVNEKAEKI